MEPVAKQDGKKKQQHHLVLVHGACHGAWCWFKLKPLLESAGHRVTALDMAASGVNTKKIEEVGGFRDYNQPLLQFMESLPPGEKVVLVGHSLGGMNISLAAEEWPEKVSLAVYLTAFLPDTVHPPSLIVEKFMEAMPPEGWLDTEFKPIENPKLAGTTTVIFRSRFVHSKLYQLTSDAQDIELAKLLLRPSIFFMDDLRKLKPLSEERYGSVKRAYIKCLEDLAIPKELQSWLVENAGVSLVKEMADTDHMPMISNPLLLFQVLQQVVDEMFG